MITQEDLQSLVDAATKAVFDVNLNDLKLLRWDAGLQTHIPLALPMDTAAVYIFKWADIYLKVGKVNSNSNARYQYHHYDSNSSRSNLSKSILNDIEINNELNGISPGQWIKENTTRFNILIPNSIGKNFVHFTEAFFILKCNPKYEDTRL